MLNKKLRDFRKLLHINPEASCEEVKTRALIKEFLEDNTVNLEVHDRGAWLYGYKDEGADQTLLFRADFDAIEGEEGCYHGCGHDGHTAILAGLAIKLDQEKIGKNIVYLFQHAEENAEGAKECLDIFKERHIDYAFALHGHVGLEIGWAGVHEDLVCCASQGLLIQLRGIQSHASAPEEGLNPAYLMSELVLLLKPLADFRGFGPMEWNDRIYDGMIMATIVYQKLGEKSFGISPFKAELGLTIRAYHEDEMKILRQTIEEFIKNRAEELGLDYSLEDLDVFPETKNQAQLVKRVKKIWKDQGLNYVEREYPHRGSEDFGYISKEVPSCYFELGLGEGPPLHNLDFEFKDEALDAGINFFETLARADFI
ncbi:MAG: amidohydrolase [Tissierellia bacterium]|nr:amidohydrolase [Tissierellia bacterium]